MGKKWKKWQTLFSWAPKSLWTLTVAVKLKDTCSLEEKQCKQWLITFLDSKITADGDCSHEIKWCLLLGRKVMTNLSSVLKSGDITLPTYIVTYSQRNGFSSSHVWMWELDCKEGWVPKNWCFWTVVLEKTLESLLNCKEIKQSILKEINPEYSLEGHAEAEAPILWPPDVKRWIIRKDPDTVKDWRQEEKEMTEDEMAGWHHWLNGHEFEQAPGDSEGQGSLAGCSPWGHKESDMNNKGLKFWIWVTVNVLRLEVLFLVWRKHLELFPKII